MASVSMAVSSAVASSKNRPTSDAFFNPLPLNKIMPVKVTSSKSKLRVEASLKERAVAQVTAVAASLVVPEMAQAADSMTPSLKNFLFSIGAGGIVLAAIAAAVVGVSNFDPVKRT
ncbi:hypothetical protein CASFOL_000159 [Castilleja foliolosa]|uniref:Ultraviolet-B-repressible protein n=1 Tax=Castilleja foliolosa TaxID=1961234 RepID=A0ABD3EMV2_9LAMI